MPRRPLQTPLLLLVVLGLVALVLVHGRTRLAGLRAKARFQYLRAAERVHEGLAADLAFRLDTAARRVETLARLPEVEAGLAPGTDGSPAGLERIERTLAAFVEIEGARLVTAEGRTLLTYRRAVPPGRLAQRPDAWAATLLADLRQRGEGATVRSLGRSGQGADLSLAIAAGVWKAGVFLGALEVTTRATSLVSALEELSSIDGVAFLLVTRSGRLLHADANGRALFASGATFAERFPHAAAAFGTRTRLLDGDHRFFARPLDSRLPLLPTALDPAVRAEAGEESSWLVAAIPESAVERRGRPVGTELAWVFATGLGAVVAVLATAAWAHRRVVGALELREAERRAEGLEREAKRVRALMEGAPDWILIVEPESGLVRETNSLAQRDLAVRAGADRLVDLVAGTEAERAALTHALSRAGREAEAVQVGHLALRARAGGTRVADARLVRVDLASEHVVEVVLRDRTEAELVAQRLRTAERLSSLGLLTAGVAHEINHPLAGIGNWLALLEKNGADPEKRAKYVGALRKGFERIGAIVRDLLSFARPQETVGDVHVQECVRHAAQMAGYASRFQGVELELELPDAPVVLPGFARGLEQVLLNLLVNAGRMNGGRGSVRVRVALADEGVRIDVEDQGPGIADDVLPRLFDPFFTTVADGDDPDGGAGTGLGLSVSYGIVQAHHGQIVAENLPGGGARFRVWLPLEPGTDGTSRQRERETS